MAKNQLTEMQEKFCQAYVELGNARQSAISAGYAEGSSSVQGSKLMNMAKIKKRIAEIRQEQGIEVVAEKDEVVERLLKMINDDNTEPQHVLTAIDKLSRIQGWFKNDSTIEVNHNNVDKLSDDELDKRLAELTGQVVDLDEYKKSK